MQFEKITTHNEDALDRIIGQYRNSEKLRGILTALCKQVKDLEDTTNSCLGKLNIDTATDLLLDKIGEIIGQSRLGFNDEMYKVLIYTRIAINISGGIPENIINIFRIITQSESVDFRELFPAGIQIMADHEIPTNIVSAVKNAVRNALPAGVGLLAMGYFDKERAFEFTDSTTKADSLHGLGDLNNPEIGGILSTLV